MRHAGDDLDLEVEAGKPIHAHRGPVGEGRCGEHLILDCRDGLELIFGISVERGEIDDVVEAAIRRVKRCAKIVECLPNLTFEIRFGRAIETAADLTGDEDEVA